MSKPHTQSCPIARFLNVFGDAWTWLVVREAFYGASRFTQFQRNTGIAKNLLSERLVKLVEADILRRENVGERGTRYAYHLTDKGRSLLPVMVSMVQWSNQQLHASGQEPVLLLEQRTGEPLPEQALRGTSGEELGWGDVVAVPGPGTDQAARDRLNNVRRQRTMK